MNLNHHAVLSLFDEDSLIITANNRLALELVESYALFSKKSVITKPKCLPYPTFLHELFRIFCQKNPQKNIPVLINDQQLQHLWQQALGKTSGRTPNQGLLDAVIESWQRCQIWQLSFQHAQFSQNDQTKLFQNWVDRLDWLLNQKNALTLNHIVSYLTKETCIYPFKKCIWYCFDEYTPEQKQLQNYLADQGICIIHQDLEKQPCTTWNYAAEDKKEEYYQVVAWVKEKLNQGQKKIGVVVPQLEQEARQLERFFNQHLPQKSCTLSLGKPLNDYPLVSHALAFLAFDKKKWTEQDLRLLLHSPYLAQSKNNFLKRAQLMQDTLLLEAPEVPFFSLVDGLKKEGDLLATLLENLTLYPKRASLARWAELFAFRLQQLGFPGEYIPDSSQYQTYQRFLLLFDDLRQLSFIAEHCCLEEALDHLNSLSKTTIFQPKREATPVRILGLLEAAGVFFDSLWITGLTDQCLPKPTKLSPFIPFSLQKKHNMPYANPEREYILAQKQLERFTRASKETVFSYPKITEDTANLPSPLLSVRNSYAPKAVMQANNNALETYTEDYKLPISGDDLFPATTHLLANQAKCPFKAFASHRLYAKKEADCVFGLSKQMRGELMHKIMELLMGTIKNQARLLAYSEETLETLIHQSILQALVPYQKKYPEAFHGLIKDIEIKRLSRLARAALAWEKKRPPFEVEAVEKQVRFVLDKLCFNLRIDRIDLSPSGDRFVIDYKSNLPTPLPWHEERPKEPQLLLYALIDETMHTLIFAALKNGQFFATGLSKEDQQIPGVTPLKAGKDFSVEREVWQRQLSTLAQEFYEGLCQPKPKPNVCAYCDFSALCRVHASV